MKINHEFRFVMNELELAVTSESRYFRVNKNFNAETDQIENKPFLLLSRRKGGLPLIITSTVLCGEAHTLKSTPCFRKVAPNVFGIFVKLSIFLQYTYLKTYSGRTNIKIR